MPSSDTPDDAKKGTGSSGRAKRAPKRPPEWSFPRVALEDAISIAQAIEDKNGGNPMDAAMVAKAVGFKRADDWRFLHMLHSANLYGLVSGSGAKATVALEPIGEDIVAPDSAEKRQKALLRAFRNVEDFKAVADFYKNKKIPEDEFFSNNLTRNFNIPRDRVDQFIEVFTKDLAYLRGFDVGSTESDTAPVTEAGDGRERTKQAQEIAPSARVRQFLDTCFVMMPFGEWFDRYYKDVYAPAIKEAGFEPVRSDELFTTGTVIEQIWHQIVKSKVLLADLSGKNANVFYELGLAHAACKPVVLAASHVDDIPFDLRHLRAIIYEVREPDWAPLLRSRVTTYLKNARTEPERSIPQPFRDHAKNALTSETEDEGSPAKEDEIIE